MHRTLMCLSLYGCQAVGQKLKKGVKTQKMNFYHFFLTYFGQPDNHTGCYLHQFILLTQGPIPELFTKQDSKELSPRSLDKML